MSTLLAYIQGDAEIGKEYIFEVLQKYYRNHKDLNIDRITAHGLRHTYASKLYNDGILNLKEISLLLGHANIHTTEKYYIHIFDTTFEGIGKKLYTNNTQKSKLTDGI